MLIPLWNSWYFFALYANAAGYEACARRALCRPARPVPAGQDCASSSRPVHRQLDHYEVANACDTTRAFLDVLTNWYIRRSRQRFWDAAERRPSVARQAFDTLYTALEVTCRVTAPLLPLTTEEIWRGLTGGGRCT